MLQLLANLQQVPGLAVIVVLIGLVCITIEIFVPGFGFFGITGIVLLFISILLTAHTLLQGIIMSAILIVLISVLVTILLRSATKGKLSKTLILRSAIQEDAVDSADMNALLGQTGNAKTILRPIGVAEINGVRLDVQTEGEYLEPGTGVVVTAVRGSKIIVRENKEGK